MTQFLQNTIESPCQWNLFPNDILPQFTDIEHHEPQDIEKASMQTISEELSARGIVVPEEVRPLVYRVIHASADFDFAENLVFSEHAMTRAKKILLQKPVIITDTNMALAGINKNACARFGAEVRCFMADPDIVEAGKKSGLTRAACSVDKMVSLYASSSRPLIFVCGNAPTALIRLRQLYDAHIFTPDLVIGVPVGFVNVVQAKELIMQTDLPYVISRGRKGGSTIAAAIVNALFYCTNI